MAVPNKKKDIYIKQKRTSISKKSIRKRFRKGKGCWTALIALSLRKSIST